MLYTSAIRLWDHLEYDFGEAKLILDSELETCHMVVFSSPAGDFRWHFYIGIRKKFFLDSHVKFFEMIGGTYKDFL